MRNTILYILTLLLLYITFDFTPYIFEYHFIFAALIRSLLLLVFLFFTYRLAFFATKSRKSTPLHKLILIGTSLLSVCIVLEILFTFIPRSHAFSQSLASKVWFTYYWKDELNTLGYRDKEVDQHDMSMPKIALIGDSFASGHGIKDIEDRFGNILQSKIQNSSVYNIAKNGASTEQELKMLSSFPLKPDIIILSYFGNDIEGIAHRSGLFFETPYYNDNLSQYAIDHSFLVSYLHSLYSGQLSKTAHSYAHFLQKAYRHPQLFQHHLDELSHFITLSRNNGIELYVVVFPFLADIDKSEEIYVRKIISFFHNNQVNTLNVADLIKGYPVSKLIVNKQDHHPNELVHRLVAENLYSLISEK